MKDLLEAFPEPNKTTTVATLLKRMIDKDFVAYEFGTLRILSVGKKD
jgi:predicted transcriptional regulator